MNFYYEKVFSEYFQKPMQPQNILSAIDSVEFDFRNDSKRLSRCHPNLSFKVIYEIVSHRFSQTLRAHKSHRYKSKSFRVCGSHEFPFIFLSLSPLRTYG